MPNNINILCNPNKKPNAINSEVILSDLGRPTKRGVKKCPGCGFLNGTRGFMCKNPLCNMIFKDSDKRKQQFDSIKLITGTSRQVYSVRVRDKGPDSRGFVQLPFYENGEKNLLSEVALCFVDTCQRLFDDSILKCHENDSGRTSTICLHIESALKSVAISTPLEFKHDLINSLNVEEDVKKKLCLLAKSTDGPIVQRIARDLMVVKCSVTPTNPLGYLHFSVESSKGDSSEDIDTFFCGCSENSSQVRSAGDKPECNKCIHYYVCVCAFASDNKLANKYLNLVHSEFDSLLFPNFEYSLVGMLDADITEELDRNNMLEFVSADPPQHIEIEVLPTEFIFEPDKLGEEIMSIMPVVPQKSRKKLSKGRIERRRSPVRKKTARVNYFDVLSFNEWLTSVTERINSTMYYGCSGNVVPLVFHIPNRFIGLLKDKIALALKQRKPHTTKTVLRDTPPIGQCAKSCWYIKNQMQLKQIFDTSDISLSLSRRFVQNTNGNFVELEEDQLYMQNQVSKYIAYLKVGSSRDEGGVFAIEWVGDLFKVSMFGELRLVFSVGQKIVDGS